MVMDLSTPNSYAALVKQVQDLFGGQNLLTYAPPAGGGAGGTAGGGGFYPYGAIGGTIFDIAKYPLETAMSLYELQQRGELARLAEQGATSRARITASTAGAGAKYSAQATVEAAKISAQARLKEASIQANSAKEIARTTTGSDQIIALMNVRSAEGRANAEMQRLTELENMSNLFKLAELFGSGRLRDTLAGRYWMAGRGIQPGTLLSPEMVRVNAPSVALSQLPTLPGQSARGWEGPARGGSARVAA